LGLGTGAVLTNSSGGEPLAHEIFSTVLGDLAGVETAPLPVPPPNRRARPRPVPAQRRRRVPDRLMNTAADVSCPGAHVRWRDSADRTWPLCHSGEDRPK
jgi:hypothetical protein